LHIDDRVFTAWAVLIILALAVLALGLVGQGDYEEAIRAHDHYCEMVNEGRWPNYKDMDCSKLKAK